MFAIQVSKKLCKTLRNVRNDSAAPQPEDVFFKSYTGITTMVVLVCASARVLPAEVHIMQTLRDQAITVIVRSRLDGDRDTGGQTIDVTVADGDLFLIGYCDSVDQRVSAIRIAKGTHGVKTVTDQIRIRTTAE